MILLKSSRELGHMRAAGRILAEVKERLKALVRPGASTKDIDEDIESFIVGKGAVPAFKGCRGYPATVCTSIRNDSCTTRSTIRSVLGGYTPLGKMRGNSRNRNAMNFAMSCECTR